MKEDIIECKICGVGSDVAYVDKETELCRVCDVRESYAAEDDVTIVEMKTPEDVVKLHNVLENIFG